MLGISIFGNDGLVLKPMDNLILFFQPSEILRDYVQCYYLAEFSGSPETQEFEQMHLSNGCAEMFISYHNTSGTCFHNSSPIDTESAIVGAHPLYNAIKGVIIEPQHKALKFVSVNFKPHGFYEIFKIPSSEIFNNFVESFNILGHGFNQMKEMINNAKDNAARIEYIDQFLCQNLLHNRFTNNNVQKGIRIADYIGNCQGNVRISNLIGEFGISERTLERNVKKALGYSIKEYCKVSRFLNLFDYINWHGEIDWADMVAKFGYYDQSHLINEFKNAIGITPSTFIKFKNKYVFKVNSHVVILKPNVVYNDISEALIQGQESYNSIIL
jgi:AraC-like DNA-binding protein